MEIKGNIEIQGFTKIDDLETGAVFVFCDENEPMLKGCSHYESATYLIRLSDGEVFDEYGNENWFSRPVRQIKATLTVE